MSARKSFIDDDESDVEARPEPVLIDFTSVLEDFLDEEVVDRRGSPIGTLACFWSSHSGPRVFLGVRLKGQESLRVVPGSRSQLDDRQACVRLRFDVVDIETAPCFDCARELDTNIERTVNEHFGIAKAMPQARRNQFVPLSEGSIANAVKATSDSVVSTATEEQPTSPVQRVPDAMNPVL